MDKCKWCGRKLPKGTWSSYCCEQCRIAAKKKDEKEAAERARLAELERKKEMEYLASLGVSTYDELVDKFLKEDKKSIVAAMFINLFVGFFGIHWFYLGQKKKGNLYLKSLGLLGFGWIFDWFYLPYIGYKNNQFKKSAHKIGLAVWIILLAVMLLCWIANKYR